MRKLSLKELNRLDVKSFKLIPKVPIVLILDNIRSALNVGSAFRTADAFALESVYLCGITATPPKREILKTALGATKSVEWKYFENTNGAIADLKEKGFKIIGIEQTNQSTKLNHFEVDKNEKYALVFGNEVQGVSDDVIPILDNCIEIPQFGTKHSLNISVCLGIVTWSFFEKMKLAD